MKTQETIIRQPYPVTILRPTSEIFVETDSKGNIIRRERSVNPIDMKLRYRALQSIQHIFEGLRLQGQQNGDFYEIPNDKLVARIDISALVNKDHYADVDESARKLCKLGFEYPDKKYALNYVVVFQSAKREKGSKFLQLTFSSEFIKCLYSHWGWTSFFDADVICSLKNVASMKMYELIARRDSSAIIMDYTELKSILQQSAKDSNKTTPFDFDRYTLEKAKEELDKKAPYSFEYSRKKDENKNWVYIIKPVHLIRNEQNTAHRKDVARQVELGLEYPLAKKILKSQDFYGFTAKEIKNNNELFLQFTEKTNLSLAKVLIEKYGEAATKDNPKGWIIGTLKKLIVNE